ncbi:MAG: hypothetical protein HYZ17_17260 [Betaproteobacteria bacterium]|nr:hypothetical protein [Betaproteobacteria bacterium]
MKGIHWLHEVLEIPSPWQVAEVRHDARRGRIDVWVQEGEVRGGWFLSRSLRSAAIEERVWRHVDLAGWRCYIHLRAQPGRSSPSVSWCGEPDMPFTGALARRVANLLAEGVKLPLVCSVLNIPIDELWKFKHGIDTGRASVGALAAPERTRADGDEDELPPLQHPVWQHLLEGKLDLEIRVLSLKLLLARLREQMRLIADPEVRLMKAQEIRHYFVRYAPLLGNELAQMKAAQVQVAARSKA